MIEAEGIFFPPPGGASLKGECEAIKLWDEFNSGTGLKQGP